MRFIVFTLLVSFLNIHQARSMNLLKSFELRIQSGDKISTYSIGMQGNTPVMIFQNTEGAITNSMLTKKNFSFLVKKVETFQTEKASLELCPNDYLVLTYFTSIHKPVKACSRGKSKSATGLVKLASLLTALE